MNTINVVEDEIVVVGLGEVTASRDANRTLTCLGLGSCVGLAMYDPVARVAGMAHIVLSNSRGKSGPGSSKYADLAVPMLIGQMQDLGALTSRIKAKIAGGAEMSPARGLGDMFKIGQENVAAVKSILAGVGASLTGSETGGSRGRTFRLNVGTGAATVSSAGQDIKEL